jgi:predicted nuclease of restriction endonuclease-like (RecB) superfamily
MATGTEYIKFLNEIKSRIITARIQAIQSVNKELIKLYWDIGKTIVERQKKYKWGDAVVEKLANDLKEAFPQAHGFSKRNIWNMRRFYEEYKNKPFLQQLVAEIPW